MKKEVRAAKRISKRTGAKKFEKYGGSKKRHVKRHKSKK